MNYLDEIAAQIELESGAPEGTDRSLFRLYALLALVKGSDVTRSDVHDAWATWRSGIESSDPDIVPFGELDPTTRAKDVPFVHVIRDVVARFPARAAHAPREEPDPRDR